MKEEAEKRKGRGKTLKHGGYAWLTQRELPPDKKHVLVYLGKVRHNLECELGPMTEAMSLILDRVLEKLGYLSLIQEKVWEEEPIIIENGIVALQPALGKNYLAFSNSVRLDLEKLIELSKEPKNKIFDMAHEMQKIDHGEKDDGANER
jgi:hypothetical protein